MAIKLTRRRITVDEYQKMAEVGILAEDERTELINGEIICMAAVGGRHVEVVQKLTHLLVHAAGDKWRVSVQSPISLPPDSEPEPDFALVQARSYRGRLPQPEDILLVIEVSDTTLAYDERIKLPLYARAAIPEAWIVDINGKSIKRHSEPVDGVYTSTKEAEPGMVIESSVLPGLILDVDSLLDL